MKLIHLFSAFALTTSVALSHAEPLSVTDRTKVLSELDAVRIATKNNDVDTIANLTFEPLMNLFGGRDAFVDILKKSQAMAVSIGLEVVSSRSLEPSHLIDAGDFDACVIPEENLMRLKDVNIRDSGFTIAIRRKGANDWRLLGGAGLRRNPQILKMLLPGFPESFEFPKNTAERYQ
jgi:hypothetical protein